MTKTAKELIEKEIKEAELSYKMNDRRSGDYIAGILKGLTIALAHVENAENTESELMEVIRNYGIDIENLEKKLATAVKALKDINDCTWHSKNRGLVVDTSDEGTVNLFDFTEKVLAEIGGKDE